MLIRSVSLVLVAGLWCRALKSPGADALRQRDRTETTQANKCRRVRVIDCESGYITPGDSACLNVRSHFGLVPTSPSAAGQRAFPRRSLGGEKDERPPYRYPPLPFDGSARRGGPGGAEGRFNSQFTLASCARAARGRRCAPHSPWQCGSVGEAAPAEQHRCRLMVMICWGCRLGPSGEYRSRASGRGQ
eukprot:5505853-Pyramimonas_sp.AAC.2